MNQASRIDISIVADPVDMRWQLWPVAGGRTWLLAWRVNPRPVDDGPPQSLSLAIAEALSACGWVVHLSASWERGLKPRHGWVRSEKHPTQWRHAVRPLFFCGVSPSWRGLTLTATRDPAAVIEAFETNWCLQAQMLFLLPPGDLPPVDRSAFRSLLRGTPPSIRSLTGTPALRGVVLPGVDGDVAQITTFDPGLWPEFEPALIAAAKARGISVRHTTEAEALRPPPTASQSGS